MQFYPQCRNRQAHDTQEKGACMNVEVQIDILFPFFDLFISIISPHHSSFGGSANEHSSRNGRQPTPTSTKINKAKTIVNERVSRMKLQWVEKVALLSCVFNLKHAPFRFSLSLHTPHTRTHTVALIVLHTEARVHVRLHTELYEFIFID